MKTELVYVYSDNWEGFYVNNLLWCEGNKLTDEQWEKINTKFGISRITRAPRYELDNYWIKNEGKLPKYFDKLPNEVINKIIKSTSVEMHKKQIKNREFIVQSYKNN